MIVTQVTSACISLAALAVRSEVRGNLEMWSFSGHRFTHNEYWGSDTTKKDGNGVNYHHLCRETSGCPGPKQTVKRIVGCPLPCLPPSHPYLGTHILLLQREKKQTHSHLARMMKNFKFPKNVCFNQEQSLELEK